MTRPNDSFVMQVGRRFDASAERVYDAFLNPAMVGRFMFASPTGRIVRCEIDARVGGAFVIIDRRDGEDVAHSGRYRELERPRRIVFTLLVEKYSKDADKVTIDVAPLGKGCELTLTQEKTAKDAPHEDRAREGWADILDVAAELLVDTAPSCGVGVAQHAAIPAKIGVMFEGLAETLELHRKMLRLGDPNTRKEDEVYRELATSWREIAIRVEKTAALMTAQRELPMGAHDETAWGADHLRAFEKFVSAQSRVLALLQVAADRDEKTLATMKAPSGA